MLPLIALAASTGLQAYSSYMQGESAREEAAAMAQTEMFRNLESRYRMQENAKANEPQARKIIGAQQVAYAASGVDVTSSASLDTYSNTFNAMLEDNLRMMREADFDNIQSKKSINSLFAKGQAAYTAGILGAAGSVAGGVHQGSKGYSSKSGGSKPSFYDQQDAMIANNPDIF